jgi:hypothetical protein
MFVLDNYFEHMLPTLGMVCLFISNFTQRQNIYLDYIVYWRSYSYYLYCASIVCTWCEFESGSWRGVLATTLYDKVCQWLAAGRWFSQPSPLNSIGGIMVTMLTQSAVDHRFEPRSGQTTCHKLYCCHGN